MGLNMEKGLEKELDRSELEKILESYRRLGSINKTVKEVRHSYHTLQKYFKDELEKIRKERQEKKEQKIINAYKELGQIKKVAKLLKVDRKTVRKVLRKHGIKIKRWSGARSLSKEEVEKIIKTYAELGNTKKTAKALGHAQITVAKYCREHFELNKINKVRRKYDWEKIRELYYKYDRPKDAAREIGCSPKTVREVWHKFGLHVQRKKPKINETEIYNIKKRYFNGEGIVNISRDLKRRTDVIMKYLNWTPLSEGLIFCFYDNGDKVKKSIETVTNIIEKYAECTEKIYSDRPEYEKYYKIANEIFPGKFKEILIISFKKRSDEGLEERIESYIKFRQLCSEVINFFARNNIQLELFTQEISKATYYTLFPEASKTFYEFDQKGEGVEQSI
ncbi:MAG: hypothetical protein QXE64_00945 [Candidatus Pacearchaeota archaeon]